MCVKACVGRVCAHIGVIYMRTHIWDAYMCVCMYVLGVYACVHVYIGAISAISCVSACIYVAYMCMCICIWDVKVCVNIYIYMERIYVFAFIYGAYMCVCLYICGICVCVHVYMGRTCVCACTYEAYMCVCMYIWGVYVCVQICIKWKYLNRVRHDSKWSVRPIGSNEIQGFVSVAVNFRVRTLHNFSNVIFLVLWYT